MPLVLVQDLWVASIAALSSFAASVSIVASAKWHGRFSLDTDMIGAQKFHKVAVPRIGGIAILLGVLTAAFICGLVDADHPRQSNTYDALLLLLAGLPAFAAGLVEDITKKVSPRIRLMATFASAILASMLVNASLSRVDIWGVDYLFGYAPAAILLTAFMVAGGANAINIIDGFHGVASSAVIIMSGAFAYLAWRAGDPFVMQLALLGMFAAIGFFLVNYPTGRIFMGDGGAYFLGFWVAEVAVLLLVRNPSINAWQVLAIVAYPVIEVLFSIYRKKFIRKMSPSLPDRVHLHMLIYRRLLCLILKRNEAQPWIRNAAVACIVSIWFLTMSILAVWLGNDVRAAILIVLFQVWLYLVVYVRLVIRHWYLYPELGLKKLGGKIGLRFSSPTV